jgi:hypothetical protein
VTPEWVCRLQAKPLRKPYTLRHLYHGHDADVTWRDGRRLADDIAEAHSDPQCAYFASEVRSPTKAMLRAAGWVDEGWVPDRASFDAYQGPPPGKTVKMEVRTNGPAPF